jgi:hypothetical protein
VSRISIEVSEEDRQRLEALAASSGQSIGEYILERTLALASDDKALIELQSLLDERIRRAEAGEVSDESVTQIFEEVLRETGR